VIERLREDRGSVLPLILGCWLLVMLIVAGDVAGTDAFAERVDLQDVCDGAAIAAANSVDLARARDRGADRSVRYLRLDDVQAAVEAYLARDQWRSAIELSAALNDDHTRVTLSCRRRTKIAFGWLNLAAFRSAVADHRPPRSHAQHGRSRSSLLGDGGDEIGDREQEDQQRGQGLFGRVAGAPVGEQGAKEQQDHSDGRGNAQGRPSDTEQDACGSGEFGCAEEPIPGPGDAEVGGCLAHLWVCQQLRETR
jgi:hypothetical protein